MFWDAFYKLCEENNTKPNAVAKIIGVSSATCTKWKNGSIPNGDTLLKLADYLKCSVDYLLGRTDDSNSNHVVLSGNTQNNINGDNSISASLPSDEMTSELIKAFQSMNFVDKMEIMNAVLEKVKK